MLRKLIASLSAFAVMAASLAPVVSAAPVVTDPELIDAVTWAYDNGLTKYDQADAFMPFNNLTREQAAKFASEFADAIRNIAPDTTRTTVCEFKDVSIMDHTLVDSVVKSCQQSIMMGYQGNFMPKQLLIRGDFATMVSRMLGGIDPMSSQQAHFDYLNSLGIMKYANLTSSITRGDALLMLYRVANGSNTDLCAIDPSLPVCQETTPIVKAGDLNVALNPASPVNYSSVPRVGSAKFATVDFTAGKNDITLYTVSLTRQGLGDYSDIDRVYFEKDGVRVSGRAAVSSDNKAVLSFAPALVIPAGKTVALDLYADLSGSKAGGEHQFVSTVINSSAANVIGSVTTPILRTADYAVDSVAFTHVGGGLQYQIDGKLVELGQFKLDPTNRDVLFRAVTLTNSGRADLSYLSGLVIERNGNVVSSSATVNGRYVTFTIKNDEILSSQIGNYTIKGIITNVDREGDSFQLYLRNTTDLNVVEKATSFRTSVSATLPAVLGNYSVKGADVRFATNAGFITTVRAPQGATDVVLMSGTLTSKVDITLEDVKLIITPTGTGADKIAKNLTLTIGTSTFTHTVSGSTGQYTGTFDGTAVIPAGQSVPVKLVANAVEFDAPADATLNIGNLLPNSFTRIEYVANGDLVTSTLGSVQGATLRVMPTNLQISNSLSAAQTVVRGATNVAVMAPKFITSYDNAVRVNQFKVTVAPNATNDLLGTTWYLKDAKGTVIANAVNTNGTLSFTNLNLLVTKAAPAATTIEIDSIPSDNNTGAYTLTITPANVDAVDTSTWSNVTPTNTLTKTITVAETASVTATTSTNNTRLVYAGQSDVSVGTMALRAARSDANVTKLVVTMVGPTVTNTGFNVSKFSSVVLKDGTTTLGTAIVSGDNQLVFDGLNLSIAAGASKTLSVVASIPALDSIDELSGTVFGLTLSGGLYTSANKELDIVGGQVMSSGIKVVKTKVAVSSPAKANGGLTPSMSFVLTPSNGNTVTLSSGAWSFLASPTNVSGTYNYVLSSQPNGGGVVYASGTNAAALTAENDLTISAPTTVYFTVTGITSWNSPDASADGKIIVSLTDFSYADTVADGEVVYAGIYASYVNDLGANISATLTQ